MREKKKTKKQVEKPSIKWPTWINRQSPTPAKLMVCKKCNAPVWTASTQEGGKSHMDAKCGGRLRKLTPQEKVEAKAALVELIGEGKDPII